MTHPESDGAHTDAANTGNRSTPLSFAARPETAVARLAAGAAAWTLQQKLLDFLSLTKPEITFLVSLSALAGFLLGSPAGVDGWTLFWALSGTSLVCAGGAALNHYGERRLDGLMRRTASRPLPAGRVQPEHARAFGFVLIGVGLAILCPLTNPLTGVLAAITVFIYLYVYTPLKRVTSFNTLVGTLPGALPALGGWTAATGRIDAGSLALFAVLVFWQMPHFLSLAWMYRKDYERAGFRMWSVRDEAGNVTARLTLAFAVLTGLAGLLPGALGLSGPLYVIGAAALGLLFVVVSFDFHRTRSVKNARRVLKASIWYIPLLLTLIMVDRLL